MQWHSMMWLGTAQHIWHSLAQHNMACSALAAIKQHYDNLYTVHGCMPADELTKLA